MEGLQPGCRMLPLSVAQVALDCRCAAAAHNARYPAAAPPPPSLHPCPRAPFSTLRPAAAAAAPRRAAEAAPRPSAASALRPRAARAAARPAPAAAAGAAAGVASDLASQIKDYDGKFGNGEASPIPEVGGCQAARGAGSAAGRWAH